jgi:hypothetical protein
MPAVHGRYRIGDLLQLERARIYVLSVYKILWSYITKVPEHEHGLSVGHRLIM